MYDTFSCLDALRSNHTVVLAEDERVERLTTFRTELQQLEPQLATLEASVLAMRERRDVLEKLIREYESLSAPVRRLPPELLMQVFAEHVRVYLKPAAPGTDWPGQDFIARNPFELTLICRYWTDLALSTPGIWANIMLNLDSRRAYPTNGDELLKRQIERSGSSNLHVTIIEREPHGSGPPIHALSLKQIVLGVADRIHTLAMCSVGDPFNVGGMAFHLPNLTHFHFAHPTGPRPASLVLPDDNYKWILSSPHLRDVRLIDATLDSHIMANLSHPSTRLSTLISTNFGVDQAFRVIRPHCDSLKVLILEIDELGARSEPPMVLNKLEELFLDFSTPQGSESGPPESRDPYPYFWQSISAPSLRILQIQDTDKQDSDPKAREARRLRQLKPFEGFVHRSNLASNLTMLLISSVLLTDDDAISIVTLFTNLRFISLSSRSEKDRTDGVVSLRLLRHIMPSVQTDGRPYLPILPELREARFSLRGGHEIKERMDFLSEVMERRCRVAKGQFTNLYLWLDASRPSDDLEPAIQRLRGCSAFGMSLYIGWQPEDMANHDTFVDLVSVSRFKTPTGIPY